MVSNGQKTMVLVDGTALAYQSFFALQDLSSPSGAPTGAVFGFYQTIEQLKQEYQPTYLAVVMDRGTPEERTEAYAEYKADRPPTPTDLSEQFPVIEELMTVLGIRVLSQEGVEADDILGCLARDSGEDVHVYIHSPDKDMLQVVSDRIHVVRRHGRNTKTYDCAGVEERYGVPPERFADLLGLMGDKVDNIPGVPGVGEKTGAKLLAEYGSLEETLDHASEIKKPKLRENLIEFREQALLSKELATLHREVGLQCGDDDLLPGEPDWSRAAEMFLELGFKRASAETEFHLQSAAAPTNGRAHTPEPTTDYRLISDAKELKSLVQELGGMEFFGLDSETTGVDQQTAELVGICIGSVEGRGWYIPIKHTGEPNIDLKVVQKTLGPLLADPKIGKIGHHLKYDGRILERHGLPVRSWCGDTMVLAHVLHSRSESLKLDDLVLQHLGRKMIPITEVIGEDKKNQITMDQLPAEKVYRYGAEDAEVTVALHEKLSEELQPGVEDWYRKVELPLAETLQEMEARGIRIAPRVLKEQSKETQTLIDRALSEVFAIAGHEFNPNSPKQLATILFDERGIPAGRDRSTRQQVLEDLARKGEPLAEKIIEYRQLAKLKSTYLDALPELIHPGDKRVHTSYSSTIANTGRISSSKPNLQNIPIRTEMGRRVREAFVAEEGFTYVAADYSQIELRVLAHFSEDPGFLEAFREGQDIHSFTAAEVFGVDIADVDKDMRRKAKEINFGLNYGMSAFGLASRLGISRGEARGFMDRYFERYPKIQAYFDKVLEDAEKNGYVETLAGRRIEVARPRSRTGAEARISINAPIQGSAADILKKAMVELREELLLLSLEACMVLTVHDEIILESPDAEVEAVAELLPKVMSSAFELIVPIEVEVRTGRSWASLA